MYFTIPRYHLIKGSCCSVMLLKISWTDLRTYDVLSFLRAFAKLRKAIISFVMSVRLSALNKSVPNGRILMKFDI